MVKRFAAGEGEASQVDTLRFRRGAPTSQPATQLSVDDTANLRSSEGQQTFVEDRLAQLEDLIRANVALESTINPAGGQITSRTQLRAAQVEAIALNAEKIFLTKSLATLQGGQQFASEEALSEAANKTREQARQVEKSRRSRIRRSVRTPPSQSFGAREGERDLGGGIREETTLRVRDVPPQIIGGGQKFSGTGLSVQQQASRDFFLQTGIVEARSANVGLTILPLSSGFQTGGPRARSGNPITGDLVVKSVRSTPKENPLVVFDAQDRSFTDKLTTFVQFKDRASLQIAMTEIPLKQQLIAAGPKAFGASDINLFNVITKQPSLDFKFTGISGFSGSPTSSQTLSFVSRTAGFALPGTVIEAAALGAGGLAFSSLAKPLQLGVGATISFTEGRVAFSPGISLEQRLVAGTFAIGGLIPVGANIKSIGKLSPFRIRAGEFAKLDVATARLKNFPEFARGRRGVPLESVINTAQKEKFARGFLAEAIVRGKEMQLATASDFKVQLDPMKRAELVKGVEKTLEGLQMRKFNQPGSQSLPKISSELKLDVGLDQKILERSLSQAAARIRSGADIVKLDGGKLSLVQKLPSLEYKKGLSPFKVKLTEGSVAKIKLETQRKTALFNKGEAFVLKDIAGNRGKFVESSGLPDLPFKRGSSELKLNVNFDQKILERSLSQAAARIRSGESIVKLDGGKLSLVKDLPSLEFKKGLSPVKIGLAEGTKRAIGSEVNRKALLLKKGEAFILKDVVSNKGKFIESSGLPELPSKKLSSELKFNVQSTENVLGNILSRQVARIKSGADIVKLDQGKLSIVGASKLPSLEQKPGTFPITKASPFGGVPKKSRAIKGLTYKDVAPPRPSDFSQEARGSAKQLLVQPKQEQKLRKTLKTEDTTADLQFSDSRQRLAEVSKLKTAQTFVGSQKKSRLLFPAQNQKQNFIQDLAPQQQILPALATAQTFSQKLRPAQKLETAQALQPSQSQDRRSAQLFRRPQKLKQIQETVRDPIALRATGIKNVGARRSPTATFAAFVKSGGRFKQVSAGQNIKSVTAVGARAAFKAPSGTFKIQKISAGPSGVSGTPRGFTAKYTPQSGKVFVSKKKKKKKGGKK